MIPIVLVSPEGDLGVSGASVGVEVCEEWVGEARVVFLVFFLGKKGLSRYVYSVSFVN